MAATVARETVETPASGTSLAGASRTTLSMRLWDLDWSKEMPSTFECDRDITISMGTFEEAAPFLTEHYPSIFGVEPNRFFSEAMSAAKRRFWSEMDIFVFRHEGKTVGVCGGHPTDWSTYYVRTFAILPEYRERRFASAFQVAIDQGLQRAEIARWEIECSPANVPMMRLLVTAGFIVTATSNTERWGNMLRFTKHLHPDAIDAFKRQFIYVPAFGRDATTATTHTRRKS